MTDKLTEAEITELLSASQERRKKIVDLRLAVLEGHLLMEEALNGFLEAAVSNPDQLDLTRVNFHTKGNFAVSLGAGRSKDRMWAVLWAINQLRNELAHNLDSPKLDERVSFLRKVYIDALEPKAAEHAKTLKDKDIIDAACAVCAGFLGQLTSEAQARRAIIDEHWEES